MDQATHNKIVSFIWGIADDVLRDLFKRGKYPDDTQVYKQFVENDAFRRAVSDFVYSLSAA